MFAALASIQQTKFHTSPVHGCLHPGPGDKLCHSPEYRARGLVRPLANRRPSPAGTSGPSAAAPEEAPFRHRRRTRRPRCHSRPRHGEPRGAASTTRRGPFLSGRRSRGRHRRLRTLSRRCSCSRVGCACPRRQIGGGFLWIVTTVNRPGMILVLKPAA